MLNTHTYIYQIAHTASKNVPPGVNFRKAEYMKIDLLRLSHAFEVDMRLPEDIKDGEMMKSKVFNSIKAQRLLTATKMGKLLGRSKQASSQQLLME